MEENYNNNTEEVNTVSYKTTTVTLPENYKPISAWGYIGYELLFSIPIVGFIMLLVYSFSDGNVNVKNFARSYLIIMLIGLILGVILVVLLGLFGVGLSAFMTYK